MRRSAREHRRGDARRALKRSLHNADRQARRGAGQARHRGDSYGEQLHQYAKAGLHSRDISAGNVLHAVEADATADENGLYAPADSTEKGVVVVDHGNARRGANYRQAGGPVYTADVPMAERLKITVTDRSSFEEGKLDDVRSATELFQPHTAVAVYAVYYKYQQAQTNLGKQEEKLDRSVPPVGAELALTMTRLEQAKASKKTQRRSMYRYHTL